MRLALLSLFLLAPVAWADPPTAPVDPVKIRVGADYTVTIKADAGKPFTAAPAFDTATDCTFFGPVCLPMGDRQYLVRPHKVGTFSVVLWTEGDKAGEYTRFVIEGIGSVDTPDKPDTPTDPDKPVPVTGLYFAVVRPDGPADPAYTRTMGLPAWDELRAAGHKVGDLTATKAALLGIKYTTLPAVVTLREDKDGSVVVRPAVPLPTTDAGVRDLLKGVK